MVGGPEQKKQLVTVGEIAQLADVGPSAVSNWRSRSSDFPLPVESSPAGDLFDLGAVTSWLQSRGKNVRQHDRTIAHVLWSTTESLRAAGASIEDGTLTILQLIYVLQASQGVAGDASAAAARFFTNVRKGSAASSEWDRMVAGVAEGSAALERVLTRSFGVRDSAVDLAARMLEDAPGGVDWADAATNLLNRYQESVGMRGTELATPDGVAHLAERILAPFRGTVYDPACGVGMLLARAWRGRSSDALELFGQEVSEYSWRLGFLHLAILGARFDLATGDTLRDDRFWKLRADRVFVDPPINQPVTISHDFPDERWAFGTVRSASDWLWVQQALHHLADDGRAVVMVLPGALFRSGSEEKVRSGIVESGMLDAVIELPPGLYAGTSVAVALLVFEKGRRNRRQRVLFVDARQLGTPRRGKAHELASADVQHIESAIAAWRSGTYVREPSFSADAEIAEIVAGDSNLSPSRYVEYQSKPTGSIDGEPIAARFRRLATEIEQAPDGISSALEELVAGARRLGTHEREPQAWPLVRLRDLLAVEPRTGMRQELEKPGTELPFIATRMVSGGTGVLEVAPTDVTRGNVRGRLVHRDDLLVVSRGIDTSSRVGCAIVRFDGESAFAESLMRLRVAPERVDPNFLRFYLTSRQGRAALTGVTTGSVIANLRNEAVGEIQVPLPPLEIQRKIVAALTRVERGMAELSLLASKTATLFDTIREGVAAGLLTPGQRP